MRAEKNIVMLSLPRFGKGPNTIIGRNFEKPLFGEHNISHGEIQDAEATAASEESHDFSLRPST